jgi:hypothetical protein
MTVVSWYGEVVDTARRNPRKFTRPNAVSEGEDGMTG